MALPDQNEYTDKKSCEAPKGPPDKKEKLLTKVVIRRLPPNMDQETFLNQISPVPTYDYFYMIKGDASLGENSFARAYVNFSNANDIYDFKEKFDNYVFLDSAGHEYPAVVEFAAFQKIPKRRNKVRVDPKVGTIESDQYYQEFVEMINKPPEQDEKPEYTYQITTENKNDSMTPLLEYVKNKRAEKMRIREERREERKRKEFERKKFREDERKKRFEEKSPIKNNKTQYTKVVSPKEKNEKDDKPENEETKSSIQEKIEKEGEKCEKSTSYYKSREKKYDDRKKELKPKFTPKKDYVDKREYKSRRDDYKDRDYRSKYEDFKKDDPKTYQKKVKKYSERREERKIEAQKAEQKRLEQQQETKIESPKHSVTEEKHKTSPNQKDEKPKEITEKLTDTRLNEKQSKSSDNQSQRRIRNKDRPTIAIYRPGMLSKRKQVDGESENKDGKKE